MKIIIRNVVWYFYYLYDRIKCQPSKNSARAIDDRLSNQIEIEIAQARPQKVIIFAAYEKERDDDYIEYFISMVEHSLVIIINNTSNHEYGVEKKNRSVIWVNRPNFGRDIAAYKLGIRSVVSAKCKHIKDLSLINDSLYILKSSFFDFFTIEFSEDVLVHSYSSVPRPHARSYLIRLKPKVLDSLGTYLETIPFAKSRYNAIINGEIGMSKNVLLQYKIVLWVYSGVFKSKKFPNKNEEIYIKNFLKDPYELSSSSYTYQPDIIKREVFEKGLAAKEQVFFSVENSDLPQGAKREILKTILTSKRYFGIKNRLKLAIGEI
jgi:hypothetical protein